MTFPKTGPLPRDHPLTAAGFVTASSDYRRAGTVAAIREALVANEYQDDDDFDNKRYNGTACPVVESISLPWWVWDDIFGALLRCPDRDSDALADILYPEDGPLHDVKHLIEGPDFINMITLNE